MRGTETVNLKKVLVVAAIVIIVRVLMSRFGWHRPSLPPRIIPALVLWTIFGIYWAIAGFNSAATQSSESQASTYFHQALLLAAFLLAFWPVPRLTGRFLPASTFWVDLGLAIQAAFLVLAVWARRHLGRNWSGEVRIAVGHQLVCTGPYRLVRHPIYTAMLGMLLGTAVVSGEDHALVGLAVLLLAYVRKTRLEENILLQAFGREYEKYRRATWALIPLVF